MHFIMPFFDYGGSMEAVEFYEQYVNLGTQM